MVILCIGSIKNKALAMLIADYRKRISTYTKLDLIEVKDVSNALSTRQSECKKIIDLEGERAITHINQKDYVILLDVLGESTSTQALNELVKHVNTYERVNIVFVIGGSLGVSEQLRKRANKRIKFSDMTFTHQMCRLIILEQIYRCYMIQNNTPYHK